MKKCLIALIVLTLLCTLLAGCEGDDSGDGYGYNKNDKYYSQNDHDGDDKINGNEFQDAVGDWLDDYGY